jgi:hypothetical protein
VPWSRGRIGIHYSPTTEFRKGQTAWNKGKKAPWAKHSKQFKKGMIPWNKGLKGFCGNEKHWNWKGGITPLRKKLHSTGELKRWRIAVLKRDNYSCQNCGNRERLEVDHIKRWHEYPELRHDINNGRTLCHDCHKKTKTYGNYRHGRYKKAA